MLTTRQQEIWQFLAEYVDAHGYPPTVREIGDAVGLASPSTVHAHLANLERAGLLKRDPTKPRAIELVGRRRQDVPPNARPISIPTLPLVGSIAAGSPLLADESVEDQIAVPEPLGRDADFLLRVKGDSMIEAGILDGDIVVVRQHPTPGPARSSSLSSATTSPRTRRRSRPSIASATVASAYSPRTPRSSRSTRSTSRSSGR